MRSGMIDLIDDAEEYQAEDEEGREWEEAQIRRGEQRRIITTDQHKPTYRPTPSKRQNRFLKLNLTQSG